jgi:tetratricopeptide (TPR) repeat protein
MKYAALSFMALIFSCIIYAQDVDALIKEAEKFERDLKEADALNTYKNILAAQPENIKALCKCAELTGRIGNRLKEEKQRAAQFEIAKSYALAALKANNKDADANYVAAATAMRFTFVTGGKERAGYLRDMKNYADSALIINPNHARALYVLGKWNFEITEMNVADKAAVKILFGGMPKASLDAAIIHFEKARTADPLLSVNYLDLANAYIKFHRTDKAIDVLNKMQKLPPRTQDDAALKAEGKTLLASLQ